MKNKKKKYQNKVFEEFSAKKTTNGINFKYLFNA